MLCAAFLAACSHAGSESFSLQTVAGLSGSAVGAGTAYQVLYSFGQGARAKDGDSPLAGLVATKGSFYGTTASGGTTNGACSLGCGTVFRVDRTGHEQVVYRFKAGRDGAVPAAGLIVNGGLVGTTQYGGVENACPYGCGTVFRVSTDGKSETILHRFSGPNDGAGPVAGVVTIRSTFYGTAQYGGTITRLCASGCGIVYSIDKSGAERVLYRFKGGKDGSFPIGSLSVLGGKLYGTTQYGGTRTNFCETGCGTVFEMGTGGKKTVLYNFHYALGSPDAAFPAAGVIAFQGKLYGTTIGGGKSGNGAAFEVNLSSGHEKVLHSFHCCGAKGDGQYPVAALVALHGLLYGTTRNGGDSDKGTVFELHTSGTEQVIHSFGGKPDGGTPQASLVVNGKALFGTTTSGGDPSEGTVFKLVP